MYLAPFSKSQTGAPEGKWELCYVQEGYWSSLLDSSDKDVHFNQNVILGHILLPLAVGVKMYDILPYVIL